MTEDNERTKEQLISELAELRQLITELRTREKQYRALVDNALVGIVQSTLGGELLYANSTAQRMFGYESLEEAKIAGPPATRYRNTEDRKVLIEMLTQTGKVSSFETECITRTGESIFVLFSAALIGDVITGMMMDITDRMRVEEALIKSEQRLIEAQRVAHVGSWEWAVTTGSLYWSDEIYRIFGFLPQQFGVTYNDFLTYVHPEDRTTVQEAVDRSLSDPNKTYSVEHRILLTDGSERTVHELGEVTFDTTGKPTRMVGTVHDITNKKQSHEALVKSEHLYRLLAENVSDVIWTMDIDLNFTYISPSAARSMGITTEPPTYKPLSEVITTHSYEIAQKALKDGLETENLEPRDPFKSQTFEVEYIRSDGSHGWAEIKASFLRDSSGKPTGILGVTRDITKRKEAEEELRIKSRNLEEVNTALKVLLEQRENDKNLMEENILFNVKKLVLPYLETLKQKHLNEEQQSYLDVLETNLNNIISPFAKRLTSIHEGLTPQEIKVADFIRNGNTVKEIAAALGVSKNAINRHRQHIRNKLGLNNQKINLRTHLLSLT
jgi:PAS domain S-box-containing protein